MSVSKVRIVCLILILLGAIALSSERASADFCHEVCWRACGEVVAECWREHAPAGRAECVEYYKMCMYLCELENGC